MLDLLSQELKEIAQMLMDNGITLNEAQEAVKAVEQLKKNNVPKQDWQRLVLAAEKLSEPDFKEVALKLLRLEQDTGMTYKEALTYFENLSSEIKGKEGRKEKLDREIKAMNDKVKKLDKQIQGYKHDLQQERQKLDDELKRNNLTKDVIEEFLRTKEELKVKGLGIPMVISVSQEFINSPDIKGEVRTGLQKLSSITEAIGEASRKLAAIEDDIKKKNKLANSLQAEIVNANNLRGKLIGELKELKEERDKKKQEYDFFEKVLAMVSKGTVYRDGTPQNLMAAILKFVERLEPLVVFFDIPCCKCKKPMPNQWTRQQVLEAFKDWQHETCPE